MLARVKDFLRSHTKYGRSRYLNFLYQYDMKRFFTYSAMGQDDAQVLAGRIRLLVHALEKGLSVKHQKANFGREKVCALLELMNAYNSCAEDPDPQAIELARSILGSYAENRIRRGEDVSFVPEEYRVPDSLAGVMTHTASGSTLFADIANGRHSVRTFSDVPVSPEKLENAIRLAQTAPSACNRQGVHVFACTNVEKIRMIFSKHGGLRGFANPGAILAITGNLKLYHSEYERNTVFVDGGIFLMNLLYALEAYGFGACPIIWGAEPDNDAFLRNLLGIPEHNEIVALVVTGNYPDEPINVPRSKRRDVKDIYHLID